MFRWTADIMDMIFCCAKNLIHVMGKFGRKVGLICIGEYLSGPEIAAVIRSRGVAANREGPRKRATSGNVRPAD